MRNPRRDTVRNQLHAKWDSYSAGFEFSADSSHLLAAFWSLIQYLFAGSSSSHPGSESEPPQEPHVPRQPLLPPKRPPSTSQEANEPQGKDPPPASSTAKTDPSTAAPAVAKTVISTAAPSPAPRTLPPVLTSANTTAPTSTTSTAPAKQPPVPPPKPTNRNSSSVIGKCLRSCCSGRSQALPLRISSFCKGVCFIMVWGMIYRERRAVFSQSSPACT